eukprot:m.61337 g.61337  ORF g.61337 m.61337 type:complete len:264 (-) comp12340_c0_seq2:19-810(-)
MERENSRKRRKDQSTGSAEAAPMPTSEEGKAIHAMFSELSRQLTEKQDRHERLVKLSRDTTIRSKRAIFVMQRFQGQPSDEAILAEATEELQRVRIELLQSIARELQGQPYYLYLRAFSPGLQEYLEAVLFHWFLQHRRLLSLADLNAQLQFDGGLTLRVSHDDFLLGIADLTGELMRLCINTLGRSQDLTMTLTQFVRSIFTSLRALNPFTLPRDMSNKMSVLASSLAKMEDGCYQLRVRGSELPPARLAEAMEQDDGGAGE